MQLPLQITFRNMEPSEAVKIAIEEKAAKLEDFHDHITSCHVIVETPHRHKHQGRVHHVKVHVTLPGHEINIDHDPERSDHEDVYVSIRDAFDAAVRQLKDFTSKRAEHR
ncbi:MAG: ribosome-associated translation inhibitor RaiA [Gammaproteobacteria bacterium]|nr:ribosome-associated translation inhibitor RaiA [Gammaproteobacteria bacterium]NIR82528.1 ribosome-associated translation inhibitor RaiA [Gammaproteobacteria bacterium]NIR89992.1 ribosome-associated translation inhibitor RaiA [Gammaproteobacteria bacterium]NIU03654.1 ribosome-associated translation inhibitor RaiA [Gammaproteobacteria bacterium]NIV51006.1 ribosome-associated translation inhibitor RaiA [Gammaproteobacteria bacterium]